MEGGGTVSLDLHVWFSVLSMHQLFNNSRLPEVFNGVS